MDINLEKSYQERKEKFSNEELIRLVTFIDETDFLLESDISIDIVNDYIAYLLKKEENNINILKNKLTVAIREKDVDLQRELLNELKNFKK